MKVLHLFSGVGGFSLGFESAGFETVAFSEVEKFPCEVLAHHWPETPNLGDVSEIKAEAAQLGSVDVITGGFPCQDLSVAGKRAGLAGDRSGLFRQIVRLAADLEPSWLVLENVPGLLSSNQGRDFGVVLDALGELGYGLAWRVLDAQHFGVPQRRRRVFIVGYLGGPCPPEVLFEPEGVPGDIEASGEEGEGVACKPETGAYRNSGRGYWSASDSASGLGTQARSVYESTLVSVASGEPARYHKGTDSDATDTLVSDTTQITSKENRCNPQPGSPSHPLATGAHPPAMAFALRGREEGAQVEVSGVSTSDGRGAAGGSSRDYVALEQMAVRRLTPLECERLQGFPDGWTDIHSASDSARYRAMGNAVAVPVVQWIAKRLQSLS